MRNRVIKNLILLVAISSITFLGLNNNVAYAVEATVTHVSDYPLDNPVPAADGSGRTVCHVIARALLLVLVVAVEQLLRFRVAGHHR